MPLNIFLGIIPIFFFSVVLHEYAHGFAAYKLGDPTAKMSGRLTLNPLKHVDPVGTIVLPVFLIIVHSPILLGWAKPVPVNFSLLKNPKRDMMWVGLSGPATNICLAVIFSLFLKIPLPSTAQSIIEMGVLINLVLAIFNLLPIPPLDGSRVVMGLLPYNAARTYVKLEKYGIIIVFLLLYFGLLRNLIWPLVSLLASFLGVSV